MHDSPMAGDEGHHAWNVAPIDVSLHRRLDAAEPLGGHPGILGTPSCGSSVTYGGRALREDDWSDDEHDTGDEQTQSHALSFGGFRFPGDREKPLPPMPPSPIGAVTS